MKNYIKKHYGALAIGWIAAHLLLTLLDVTESIILKIALINAG